MNFIWLKNSHVFPTEFFSDSSSHLPISCKTRANRHIINQVCRDFRSKRRLENSSEKKGKRLNLATWLTDHHISILATLRSSDNFSWFVCCYTSTVSTRSFWMAASSNSRRNIDHPWRPNETAGDVFSRIFRPPLSTGLPPIDDPWEESEENAITHIEVVGESGSGKSILLLHIVAHLLYPKKWGNIDCGGCEAGVLWVDCDGKFDVLVLSEILTRAGEALLKGSRNHNTVHDFVKESLSRLEVVRCYNSTQFLCILSTLPPLIETRAVRCIVLDSLSTFFWNEKLDESLARKAGQDRDGRYSGRRHTYKMYAQQLKRAAKQHKLYIYSSRSVLFQQDGYIDSGNERQASSGHMPQSWVSLFTLRAHLSLASVNKSGTVILCTLTKEIGEPSKELQKGPDSHHTLAQRYFYLTISDYGMECSGDGE